jgi:hypothetical protein
MRISKQQGSIFRSVPFSLPYLPKEVVGTDCSLFIHSKQQAEQRDSSQHPFLKKT